MTNDVVLAWRSLRSRLGTTILSVGVLALGIGVSIAIAAFSWHVLFKPLSYSRPNELVFVWDSTKERPLTNLTPGRVVDLSERMQSFAGVAGIGHVPLTMTGRGMPERFAGVSVSSNFFDVLGVGAALGRVFHAREPDRRLVVLSDALWRRRFAADPSMVGSALTLDGATWTVVGIMSPNFHWTTVTATPVIVPSPELWAIAPANDMPGMPVAYQGDLRLNRRIGYLRAIARLKPGVTIEQARAEAAALSAQLAREHPEADEGRLFTPVAADAQLLGHVRAPVLMLLAAAALLLLGAGTNVANLQLMRVAGKRRDLAVQAALGAAPGRIARQLAAESMLLAAAGGAAGLALAWVAVPLFKAVVPMEIPRLAQVVVDPLAAATGAMMAITSGVANAVLLVIAARLNSRIATGDRSATARVSSRGRRTLVAAEVATALVLVTGAALFSRSLAQLQRVDVGIRNVDRLLTFNLVLAGERRGLPSSQRVAFYEQVLERLRALPGVELAATAATLPIGGDDFGASVIVEGAPTEQPRAAGYQVVGAGWFETLGIPLLRGRDFTPADTGASGPVVMVNQAFADQHWPGQDPLGRQLKMDRDAPWATVVGLVGNIRHLGPKRPPRPEVYEPQFRSSFSFTAVVVRAAGDPLALVEPIRREVARLDPAQPISSVATMGEHVGRAQAELRSLSSLTSVFGCTALLVAALGIYGAMAFAVAQRRREFGVRLALGATPRQVARLVVREALVTASVGALAGLGFALAGARAVQGLLFNTPAIDVLSYGAAAIVLGSATVLAAYVPARSAMRADPVVVLRSE